MKQLFTALGSSLLVWLLAIVGLLNADNPDVDVTSDLSTYEFVDINGPLPDLDDLNLSAEAVAALVVAELYVSYAFPNSADAQRQADPVEKRGRAPPVQNSIVVLSPNDGLRLLAVKPIAYYKQSTAIS